MPFQNLIKHYKGGTGSGDWGHRGRPGKRGGSGGGGGKFVVVSPNYMKAHAPKGCPDGSKSMDKMGCRELRNYTGGEHRNINKILRGQIKLLNPDDVDRINKDIDSMDRMFRDAKPLEKTITVRRGLGSEVLNTLQPGDSFQDTGFVSTTIGATLKDSGIVGSKTIMTIKVPKGVKGLYLENISMFHREKEFLLPRGSKFNVDARRVRDDGILEYDVSLIKQ